MSNPHKDHLGNQLSKILPIVFKGYKRQLKKLYLPGFFLSSTKYSLIRFSKFLEKKDQHLTSNHQREVNIVKWSTHSSLSLSIPIQKFLVGKSELRSHSENTIPRNCYCGNPKRGNRWILPLISILLSLKAEISMGSYCLSPGPPSGPPTTGGVKEGSWGDKS
ncbi:hypothetical protein NPIL_340371 [Nephila pilipes]|uniref:Uncharacterized protein n=1 Tax=Nephila pilipes TaxID=299642 RepID=A0A8X6NJE5_NEPPI|nr:hypothetical protein NPIL_340371 [Nephila pilipes]